MSDIVVDHFALVSVAPWPSVAGAADTELIASITHLKPTLTFSLGDAPVDAPPTAFETGFSHVRSGLDHVLIMLILAMGVTSSPARFSSEPGPRSWWPLVRHTLAASLAFAAGHSVSLVLVSTTDLRLPSGPIEVIIAATIALGAGQLWTAERRGETARIGLLALAGIGLVHGFGFAGALDDVGVTGSSLGWNVLAFNGGLEVAQLAALALFVPVLLVAGRSRTHRLAVSGAMTIVAAVWIVDRLGDGWLSPYLPVKGFGTNNPEIVAAVVLLSAAVTRLLYRTPPLAKELSTVPDMQYGRYGNSSVM